MVMVNLGSTDDLRYTGYREITDRAVLDLQCNNIINLLSAGFALKAPRKTASENVVCLCRLLNILADFSNLFLHKAIRLLLKEQSDLGLHCLQKWLLKSQADDKADNNSWLAL